jgi:adenine-specific DNA-methyltransferase
VVGNPPYFEMYDLEETLQDRFSDVISGRANIYSLFLKVGLDALKEGGYLAFVIPPSMNNGAYFRKLRQYIVDQAGIYFLKVYSSDAFQDAQQSVMVLILQKGIKRNSYIFQKDDLLIFSEDAHHLQQAFKGKETLSDYGFKVKTGQVVWNQHKERLASERGDDTSFLVWAHNIDDSGAIVAKDKKPQFFRHGNKFAVQKGPAILVNRITGKVNGGTLRAAVVDEDFEFLAENHVNVITHNKCKDIKYYNDICDQLRSRETSDLIKCLTGNTQISKTELEKLIPLKSL